MLSRGLGSSNRWKSLLAGERSISEVVERARELIAQGAVRGLLHQLGTSIRNVGQRVGLVRAVPPQVVQDLRRVAEGPHVMLVFSAEEPGRRYLRSVGGLAFEALLREGRVRVVDLEGGDHVISPSGARRSLVEVATRYLDEACPVVPAARSDRPHDVPPPHEGPPLPWTSN